MTQASTAVVPSADALTSLRGQVESDGFAFVAADVMYPLLGGLEALSDCQSFAASWNDLKLDTYLPDGHRYRRRRYATLSVHAGETRPQLQPHQPHYQSTDYNPLVGGIERWFEPMRPEIVNGPTMQHVLAFCCDLFGALGSRTNWKVECHQFRIEARADAFGQPTPEGVHRDGVDYVLVLLINRTNIKSGTTTVHDLHGNLLGSFTLTAPFDAALVDDSRVKHGVTAVEPIDGAMPAYRDVLVVTFKAR
ncbi:MAG: 2OG-Fe dioxygenase family protein [Burkholderiaceae bacterium]